MENGKTALGLDNNVGALVCYLNICLPIGFVYSIIVLVTDKTNKLPRFHAFQSLLLTAAAFVLSVILAVFFGVIGAVANSSIIALFGSLIQFVVAIAILGAVIYSAIKAYGGEIFKLPVIGEMADKWSS
jgi:uncharacterized membrane protein